MIYNLQEGEIYSLPLFLLYAKHLNKHKLSKVVHIVDKKKYMLMKFIIRLFCFISFVTLLIYGIPIVLTFELNVYNMELITINLSIATIVNASYYYLFNKIICRLIKMTDIKNVEKFIRINDIAHPTILDIINIIFIGFMLITYFLWWIKADLYFMSTNLYFTVVIMSLLLLVPIINDYLNNYNKLNIIIRKYYDEVLNS